MAEPTPSDMMQPSDTIPCDVETFEIADEGPCGEAEPSAASSAANRSREAGAGAGAGAGDIDAGSGAQPIPCSFLKLRLHPDANPANLPRVKAMLMEEFGVTMTLCKRKGYSIDYVLFEGAAAVLEEAEEVGQRAMIKPDDFLLPEYDLLPVEDHTEICHHAFQGIFPPRCSTLFPPGSLLVPPLVPHGPILVSTLVSTLVPTWSPLDSRMFPPDPALAPHVAPTWSSPALVPAPGPPQWSSAWYPTMVSHPSPPRALLVPPHPVPLPMRPPSPPSRSPIGPSLVLPAAPSWIPPLLHPS